MAQRRHRLAAPTAGIPHSCAPRVRRLLDEKRFLANCIGVGRQYKLQKRIHAADSISKVLFQTALRLARNRDLLVEGAAESGAARLAFATEIHDVLRRVDIIVALAASSRAGFRSRVLPKA